MVAAPRVSIGSGRSRLILSSLTPGVCIKYMATCGNGWRTVIGVSIVVRRPTGRLLQAATVLVSCEADLGSKSRVIFARPIAGHSTLSIGAATEVSEWHGRSNITSLAG